MPRLAIAQNLIQNPGFEIGDGGSPSDPSGWVEFGPDLTGERSPLYKRSGSYSAKRWTGGDFQEYGYYQEFAVTPGEEYLLEGYLFSPSGDALSGSSYACIRIEFYTSGGALLLARESSRLRSSVSQFKPYNVQAVAPATAAKGRFVYAVGGGASPHLGAAFCDDVSARLIAPRAMTDDEFLDDLQQRIFAFFWNETSALGLTKDRAGALVPDTYTLSSIASVGFGLPVICTAVERGWVTKADAYSRIQTTLLTFRDVLPNDNGFFHHFQNMNTGAPDPYSEVSTIDTAILAYGALFAGDYWEHKFGDSSLKLMAKTIYERINWPAKYNGWSTYSEYIMMDILAMGSPTHPCPASIWNVVNRTYRDNLATRTNDHSYPRFFYPPLFVHQYPQCFLDLDIRRDAYTQSLTYFESSANHTRSNRQYCVDHSASLGIKNPKYQTYSADSWGLTSGDGPDGYRAYGEADPAYPEPANPPGIDGTVLPHAPGGSVMFEPDICIQALRYMRDNFGPRIWGRYGFSDSFNVDRNWWAPDVIGIDLSAMFLSIENYRTGLIWKVSMRNSAIRRGLDKAGFVTEYPPSTEVFESAPVWGGSCGGDEGGVMSQVVPIAQESGAVGGNAWRVSSGASAGAARLCLNGLKALYNDNLVLWIKGDSVTSGVSIRLADAYGREITLPLGQYLPEGQVTQDWQMANVPLAAFAPVSLVRLESLAIVLSQPDIAVTVDAVSFTGSHPDAGTLQAQTLAEADAYPEGVSVQVGDLIASEQFGSFFYAQQLDRAAGIRVQGTHAVTVGDLLSLGGTIQTVDGERTFVPSSVGVGTRLAQPRPLGVGLELIEARAASLTGLRIKTWGTAGQSSGDEFALISPNGHTVAVIAPAVPKPDPGSIVLVTGEVGARLENGTPVPVVRVRSWTDVEIAYSE